MRKVVLASLITALIPGGGWTAPAETGAPAASAEAQQIVPKTALDEVKDKTRKLEPVQMLDVGTKWAKLRVLTCGRRTFSTPCPGNEPIKASRQLIVSTRAAKPKLFISLASSLD